MLMNENQVEHWQNKWMKKVRELSAYSWLGKTVKNAH
jgi:flagellar biosynthesis chaperone FliJ